MEFIAFGFVVACLFAAGVGSYYAGKNAAKEEYHRNFRHLFFFSPTRDDYVNIVSLDGGKNWNWAAPRPNGGLILGSPVADPIVDLIDEYGYYEEGVGVITAIGFKQRPLPVVIPAEVPPTRAQQPSPIPGIPGN